MVAKKMLVILLVGISLVSCGTTKTVNTPGEMSREVVTTNSKDENYVKANEWMVENFNDAESVVQFTDKAAGVIKGKYLMGSAAINNGSAGMPSIGNENLYAVITLRVKDQRSRIEINMVDKAINTYSYANVGSTNPTTESLKLEMNRLMSGFVGHMQGESKNATW